MLAIPQEEHLKAPDPNATLVVPSSDKYALIRTCVEYCVRTVDADSMSLLTGDIERYALYIADFTVDQQSARHNIADWPPI